MSFAREQRRINQQNVFNPPPGYYQQEAKAESKMAPSFGQSGRFAKFQGNICPGPGAYYNNQKDVVRKRLIEESQKRQIKMSDSNGSNNIKISSIPSIPKKSATRVYQELAPGILILHEEQYENTSIGPGSYNINDKLLKPKQVAHRIAPEPRKRVQEDDTGQINVPTVAEEIRNAKRMMYKQNLIKSSTVNKSEINPSDLCLEVIILREKLLRSDDNPPPGYYYNENSSDFKPIQEQRQENQFLGGREKRFQDPILMSADEVGPGHYKHQEEANRRGGFIPKSPRKLHAQSEDKPGPGTYIAEKDKPRVEAKGNYPPIFGSGCTRFPTAPKIIQSSMGPGPGSYQIDKKKNKKQKYIKIKRQLLQPSKGQYSAQPTLSIQNELINVNATGSAKERKLYQFNKNSSSFASKVHRFQSNKTFEEKVGPGIYQVIQEGFSNKTFNKKQDGYIGNRVGRFDETEIRPKLGPGVYNPAYETVKEKKIKNVFL